MANKVQILLGAAVIVAASVAAVFGIQHIVGGAAHSGGSVAATAGGPPVLRRLTQAQYKHVIADVFGPDIKIGGRFDPDIRDGD